MIEILAPTSQNINLIIFTILLLNTEEGDIEISIPLDISISILFTIMHQ